MSRITRAQEEIRRFLGIRPVQVAELDIGTGTVGPGPGSPPLTHGEAFVLVRKGGRPIGTLLGHIPEGTDPKTALTALARELPGGGAGAGVARAAGMRGAAGATEAAGAAGTAGAAKPAGRPGAAGARGTAEAADAAEAGGRPGAVGTPGTAEAAGTPGAARPPGAAEAAGTFGVAGTPGAARAVGVASGGAGGERPAGGGQGNPGEPFAAPAHKPPYTTVVVATRERADRLARALDSLLAQDHPRFETVVVDNAPVTGETRELVERKYGERVRYVCEPVPGLAVAHNTGLATARGEVVAFTDDDVVADPRWLTELTAPFAADPGLGCTTGLILPARLRTPAQVLLESHGGFAKGFTPRTYDPKDPPPDEPLFPFTAGRFGSGANMAFRTDVLRSVGGFDPATGAGTPARGGDDLYGFVRVLADGHRLRYTPSALVWHHHRETWRDLEAQAYGYGAGLTAYLTAILVNRPALLPAFLARLPRGLAHARALTAVRETDGGGAPGGHDTRTHPWPRRLSRLQRRGMVYGPVGYLRARRALRGAASRGSR